MCACMCVYMHTAALMLTACKFVDCQMVGDNLELFL